jgi:hemerythrin
MAIAEWSEEYRTGHKEIDTQHQQLFALVNQIDQAVSLEQQPKAQLQALLETFHRQAKVHFDLEETLMEAYQYENIEVHKGTHRALVGKVQTLLDKLAEADAYIPREVTQLLADWMIHHIKGEDRQMIRFFQAQNRPQAIASSLPLV